MSAIAEAIFSGRSQLPVCLWKENPNGLVSLLDLMLPFHAENFCSLFAYIGQLEQIVSLEPHDVANADLLVHLDVSVFMPVSFTCAELDLKESLKFVRRLNNSFKSRTTVGEVLYGLKHLRELIQSEMQEHLFFHLQSCKRIYYESERPVGDSVYDAFPSARFDLKEGARCLAFGRNVAAGFHLMRAAEVGMRELGRDRRIQFALDQVIEFREWGQIIGQLETATKVIQQWPASSSREKAHKFYNSALVELRSFNDGWRRHLAHVRPSPEMHDDDAIALWGHVSRFLVTLASRISEGKLGSDVWI